MADFLLRNVDAKLWKQFRAKAIADGRTLRWVIIDLIRRYVVEKDGER